MLVRRYETEAHKVQLADRSHHTVLLTSEVLGSTIMAEDLTHLETFIDETILHDPNVVYVEIVDRDGSLIFDKGMADRVGRDGYLTFSDEIYYLGGSRGGISLTWDTAFISEQVNQQVTNATRLINGLFVVLAAVIVAAGYFLVTQPLARIEDRIEKLRQIDQLALMDMPPIKIDTSSEWMQLSDATNQLHQAIIEHQAHEAALLEARNKALEASQLKTEFLSNLSHEFRTPLNGILGLSELLVTTDLDEEQRDYAKEILMSGGRLNRMVSDALDFATLEKGEIELERSEFALVPAIEESIEPLTALAGRNGVALKLSVAENLPPLVLADKSRLQQVVYNLVDNAVKFTNSGSIDLFLDAEAETRGLWRFQLEVSDTGVGIPANKLDAIFGSFTQVDGSLTRQHEGNGLGLSISRGLAECMGGTIAVKSQVGRGSTFTLTFLATSAELSPTSAD